MTSINQKLGLRPGGKRNMMKLPKSRAAAADLTAAQCPACGRRGVTQHTIRGVVTRMCTWCHQQWPVEHT